MRQDPLALHAYAKVGAGVGALFGANRGFDSVTRIGAGAHELVLTEGLDHVDAIESVTCRSVGATVVEATATIRHETADDKKKTIFTTVAGAAADVDFTIVLRRAPQ